MANRELKLEALSTLILSISVALGISALVITLRLTWDWLLQVN